jgi:hypothetical protein
LGFATLAEEHPMSDEIEFQGTIYKTRQERNAALALTWMTAKGTNSVAEIDAYISSDATPETAAVECIATWGLLDQSEVKEGDETAPRFTREEIVESFRAFWHERPDRLMKSDPLPAVTA